MAVALCYAGVTLFSRFWHIVKLDFRAMPRKIFPANVVGPQIRKQRARLGLSQEQLAALCQLAGLDISRSTLAQIEIRFRYITDTELLVIAAILGLLVDDLYPTWMRSKYRRCPHKF